MQPKGGSAAAVSSQAAAGALVVATALHVAVGGVLSHCVSVRHLQVPAGIGFILIGAWTMLG
jgi:putative Ca2+/H+ antiporter (TMEM165/GDT1 family)